MKIPLEKRQGCLTAQAAIEVALDIGGGPNKGAPKSTLNDGLL